MVINTTGLAGNDALFLFKKVASIRRLQDMNAAFTMKLWWHFRTSNSLWAQLMKAKYYHNAHHTDNVKKLGSTAWKRLVKIGNATEAHMKWIVCKWHINF